MQEKASCTDLNQRGKATFREARSKCPVAAGRQRARILPGFCGSSQALLWPYFAVHQRKQIQIQIQLWIITVINEIAPQLKNT